MTNTASHSWSVGRDRMTRLTLLLLLVVLAPSACLVWFMTQTVKNERLASRQKLTEAYAGYLSIARQRLEAKWPKVPASDGSSPAELFAKIVLNGSADAALILDETGGVAYPATTSPQTTAPTADSAAWRSARSIEGSAPAEAAKLYEAIATSTVSNDEVARALLAKLRSLFLAGETAAAIKVLKGEFAEERYRYSTDKLGRLIIPNARMLAIEFLHEKVPNHARELVDTQRRFLLDYSDTKLPPTQRRFLMRSLNRVSSDPDVSRLLAAEDLALSLIEKEEDNLSSPELAPTSLPGIWKRSMRDTSVLMLFTLERLQSKVTNAPEGNLPAGVDLHLVPPGTEAPDAIAIQSAGFSWPGWRLAISADPDLLESESRDRITAHMWTGALTVAAVLLLGGLAFGMIRRQTALTELRNDLVANVSHELKTPLSSMRLLVDTLLDAKNTDPKTTREYLELIAGENLRLSRVIENFLAFSRIERNRYHFQFEPIDPAELIKDAAAAMRERFNSPDCTLQIDAPDHLPEIALDRNAMLTALVNLLENAWKYSGGKKEIRLALEQSDDQLRFSVTDNGIGLTEADRARIFQRFQRVGDHLSQQSSGCGLGLSIVRFIVEGHKGTIDVESQPGRGSTFTITVPLAQEPTMEQN